MLRVQGDNLVRNMKFRPSSHLLLILGLFATGPELLAQGVLSGGLESNTILYRDDPRTGIVAPENGYGSMNYLKLNYLGASSAKGGWGAGLQMEINPSVISGYDPALRGAGLTGIYFSGNRRFGSSELSVTVGDFYEQFGSGLVLRSWEDRELGIANSIGGARVKLDAFDHVVKVTALGGFPRYGIGTFFNSRSATLVSGGNVSLDVGRLVRLPDELSLSVEGSLLDRYESRNPRDLEVLAAAKGFALPAHVPVYSVGGSFGAGGFSLGFEWAGKGNDLTAVHKEGGITDYGLEKGHAWRVEASFSHGPFSVTATARELSNMENRLMRTSAAPAIGNTLNYLPALCQMQTYMLASLNPYATLAEGERGYQGDAFWRIPKGSALGGKYGTTLHAGGAWIQTLPRALSGYDGPRFSYRELNVDIDRRWSRSFRTVLFMSIQEKSPSHGQTRGTEAQNVFVLDATWKSPGKLSLRGELQYLYSRELTRDWMAGLLELNYAPHWGVFVSDMYNHGDTRIHYYNFGASYSLNAFRVALSYGRNRAGMVCSGGVCRFRPAYSGGQLSLQYSF